MFERIKQMVIKEFIQVFRDKRMKAIVCHPDHAVDALWLCCHY
jgi:hypothetical protein